MMSFEECQEMGRQIRKNYEESEARIRQAEADRLKKLGIAPMPVNKPKYEHPSMPDDGLVIILFIIGYIACLLFKGWWVGWIALSAALGKFLSRHDND